MISIYGIIGMIAGGYYLGYTRTHKEYSPWKCALVILGWPIFLGYVIGDFIGDKGG